MLARDRQTNQFKKVYVKALDSNVIGTILPYAGTTLPDNYMFCNGDAISRTTYSALFDAIGTSFGTGDGSTTFNLPNLKGRVLVGLDGTDTDFDTIGKTSGEKSEEHYHLTPFVGDTEIGNISKLQWNKSFNYPTESVLSPNTNTLNNTPSGTSFTGYQYGTSKVNLSKVQPSLVINFIIKVSETTPRSSETVNTFSNSTKDAYSCGYINNTFGGEIIDGTPYKTGKTYNGKDVYRLVKNLGYLPEGILSDQPIAIGITNFTLFTMPKIMYAGEIGTPPVVRYYPNPFMGSSNINSWINATSGDVLVTTGAGRSNLQLVIDIEFIYNS